MSDSVIQIEVKGPAADYLKKISDPSQVLRALARTMDQQNQLTIRYTVQNRLNGVGPYPVAEHRLGFRSGVLKASLRSSKPRFEDGGLVSSIGTNVSYAAIHEFGADIPSRPTRSRNKAYAKKHPTTKAYSIPERRPVR